MSRKRVAIVGSGVSGLGALWALKRSTNHDVHLFEADNVLGGHTNTVKWRHDGKEVNVDTGFIVYNLATYPNFIEFLKNLGVEPAPTDMTFGVTRDGGSFEWCGTSLGGIFAQKKNILSPSMWRMIFDVVRFNLYAVDILADEEESELDPVAGANGNSHKTVPGRPQQKLSIGEYLEREGYSAAFRDGYLIPMTAAVWSTAPDKCTLEFPAVTLIRFMWNHHLLNTIAERPSWMTIPGGSQKYVDAVMEGFPQNNVHLSSIVTNVEDINGKVIVQLESGEEDLFDHVILACHGDQTRQIIADGGTQTELDILDGFQTTENIAYLHNDLSQMPIARAAWSAWNLLTTSGEQPQVTLTYNMNILQHIPVAQYSDVLVTLNPKTRPSSDKVQGTYTYHHPVYNDLAIQSQKRLPSIQNKRGISYAGAWTKYGFHEDGFSSGLKVAIDHLGAKLPWDFVDSTFSRGRRRKRPVFGGLFTRTEICHVNSKQWASISWTDWIARGLVWWIQVLVTLVEVTFGIAFWPLGLGKYRRRKPNYTKLD